MFRFKFKYTTDIWSFPIDTRRGQRNQDVMFEWLSCSCPIYYSSLKVHQEPNKYEAGARYLLSRRALGLRAL